MDRRGLGTQKQRDSTGSTFVVMEQFHILKCDVGYTMCASFKTQNHILKRAVVFYVKLYFSKLDFKKT